MADVDRPYSIRVRPHTRANDRCATGSAGVRARGSRPRDTNIHAPVATTRSSGCSNRSSRCTCSGPASTHWSWPDSHRPPGPAVCTRERVSNFRTRRIADSNRARGRACRVHSHDRNRSSERTPALAPERPRNREQSKAPPPHVATWSPQCPERGSPPRSRSHGIPATVRRRSGYLRGTVRDDADYRKPSAPAMQADG